MKPFVLLLTLIALTSCANTISTIDTLCTVTTRYHASEEQIATFGDDQTKWESLVNWLASFNRERDKRC